MKYTWFFTNVNVNVPLGCSHWAKLFAARKKKVKIIKKCMTTCFVLIFKFFARKSGILRLSAAW